MFGQFEDYRETPIPVLDEVKEKKKGYREFPIDSEDILYNNSYSDIRDSGLAGENLYYSLRCPPYYERIKHSTIHLYLRNWVIERFQRANGLLRKIGLELFFYDCWRPIEVQNYFHDVWFPAKLREWHPDWTEEKIMSEVDNYWAKGAPSSNEVDPNSPPPHSTGAAADLTIRRCDSGKELYMGSIVDDVTEVAHTDYFEKLLQTDRQLSFSEVEAMKNRRLIYWVLTEHGFANNPTEWWHYSYGDQMWAKLTDNRSVHFSYINPLG